MWGLLNPACEDFVTKDALKVFFDDLAYFAIELPLKICQTSDTPDPRVLSYLTDLNDLRERFFFKKIKEFNKDITRHELGAVLGEEYT